MLPFRTIYLSIITIKKRCIPYVFVSMCYLIQEEEKEDEDEKII